MEIKNARITSTMLGYEDHGVLTYCLSLDYGGTCQGFGTYGLDEPIKDEAGKFLRRQGTAYGCESIARILKVVGVDKWEDLKGKHIRVEREDGWGGLARKIGNIIKDEWFDPKALADELCPAER